jgi:hypothetical protein
MTARRLGDRIRKLEIPGLDVWSRDGMLRLFWVDGPTYDDMDEILRPHVAGRGVAWKPRRRHAAKTFGAAVLEVAPTDDLDSGLRAAYQLLWDRNLDRRPFSEAAIGRGALLAVSTGVAPDDKVGVYNRQPCIQMVSHYLECGSTVVDALMA